LIKNQNWKHQLKKKKVSKHTNFDIKYFCYLVLYLIVLSFANTWLSPQSSNFTCSVIIAPQFGRIDKISHDQSLDFQILDGIISC